MIYSLQSSIYAVNIEPMILVSSSILTGLNSSFIDAVRNESNIMLRPKRQWQKPTQDVLQSADMTGLV